MLGNSLRLCPVPSNLIKHVSVVQFPASFSLHHRNSPGNWKLWSVKLANLKQYSVYSSLCPAVSQMSVKSTLGCHFGACSNADHKADELKLLRLAQGFLVFSAFPISCVSSGCMGPFCTTAFHRWVFIIAVEYV